MARRRKAGHRQHAVAAARQRSVAPATIEREPDALSVALQRAVALVTADRLALATVLLAAAVMDFFRLGRVGYANLYYAAGVRSMLDSVHNLFFVAFDPAGFLSVDKPPLGFWLQAASAHLFGYGPLNLLLPQALAGVASVGLLFLIVRRVFGTTAGFVAGLALAFMPVNVATNRSNVVDGLLVLTTLGATWAFARAHDDERRALRWLLLGGALLGAGFNIKAAQALLVVPALYLFAFAGLPFTRGALARRAAQLGLATVVLAVLALAWPLAYDAVPASERPWVISTEHNRQTELIFKYNSVQRISSDESNGGLAPGGDGGDPAVLRLYNEPMGGEAAWLLPLALAGLVVAWRAGPRPRLPLDRRHAHLLLWGTWLLSLMLFFSVAGTIHTYYLVMLTPAIAALVGIGIVALRQAWAAPGWRGWLLPVVIAATAASQILILRFEPDWRANLVPGMLLLTGVAVAGLVGQRLLAGERANPGPATAAAALGLAGLLVAPAVWAGIGVWEAASAPFPAAGPKRAEYARIDPGALADPAAQDFLLAHRGAARFLVATRGATTAAPFIVDTGQPALAIGGFNGDDPIFSEASFQALVASGDLRYVLITPKRELPQDMTNLPADLPVPVRILVWVSTSCTLVPETEWRTTTFEQGGSFRQLYDCAAAS